MAILVNMAMPDGVPIEMLDAVTAEMNAKADPPAGLIVHVDYVDGGRVRGVDVWESQEAFDAFGQNRLGPAIGKIAAQHGMEPGEPETTIVQLHDVVRGR
jgi:hypothetical protein